MIQSHGSWGPDNQPIELWSNKVIDEKIDYIHNNPVEEGLIFKTRNYLHSSAADYAGKKGILENVIVAKQPHAIQSRGSGGYNRTGAGVFRKLLPGMDRLCDEIHFALMKEDF